jgi:hypothetical protein
VKIDLSRPKKLYRYSERKWLSRSLALGEFRLRPASDYREMEGAGARTDDELRRRIPLHNSRLVHVKTGLPIGPPGDVIMSSDMWTDYLTLCLATVYSDHFYEDFAPSDGCLVIHDPDEFFRRMYRAVASAIPRSWGAADGAVRYGAQSRLGPAFIKPEKFVFQFEWRFVCLPIPALEKCQALKVTIGNIEDIAEVVLAEDFRPNAFPRS